MSKLYTEKDGTHFPTELHKTLGSKADIVIEKLFNELLESGVDIIEAKYIIDYSAMNVTLNKLINLK